MKAVFALVLAAICGSLTFAFAQDTAAPGTTLEVAQTEALGDFLVDADGMTLYLFTKDTENTSTCYDDCASAWPPFLTDGEAAVGEGLDASLLGTTERTDGTVQVTYNGWPLYHWAKDEAPGDTTGQDIGEVWYVVSPAGEAVQESGENSGS